MAQQKLTYDQFRERFDNYFFTGKGIRFSKLLKQYPEHLREMIRQVYESPGYQELEAQWPEMKARLTEEFGEEWVKENCTD